MVAVTSALLSHHNAKATSLRAHKLTRVEALAHEPEARTVALSSCEFACVALAVGPLISSKAMVGAVLELARILVTLVWALKDDADAFAVLLTLTLSTSIEFVCLRLVQQHVSAHQDTILTFLFGLSS